MGRWQPDARGRLQEAAMTLFIERGYDEVTVADIAERAGLTKRSFFNHFADKREVVFANVDAFQALVLAALADADLLPLDATVQAFTKAAEATLVGYPELTRARQDLIDSSPELRERDLMKTAGVTRAVADALARRGARDREAAFAAQAATMVFTAAVDAWSRDPARGFEATVVDALGDLRAVMASPQPALALSLEPERCLT
jgi:AcrR family transcriptional regulator